MLTIDDFAMKKRTEVCDQCGQPMLPPGIEKKTNEYDHASGCPRWPLAQQRKNRTVTVEDLTLEKHVALAGREWLTLNGWTVHRLEADVYEGRHKKAAEREEPGTPDYIVFRDVAPYRLWYWEAKRPKKGVLSASQILWRKNHPNTVVCVANSFESLKAWVLDRYPWSVRTK